MRWQERLAQARQREEVGDCLLLLQHPPVITVGRGGGEEDILAPRSVLEREGITVCPTDRGGRATYHGPGQLVVYPIMRLPDGDLYAYVHRLEEVVIRVLAGYGVAAGRLEKYPGVWVDDRKIAAIGIAVRDGVTRHGLALNVDPPLEHFTLLVPCGIRDKGVTSLRRELGRPVALAEVEERFIAAFGEVFQRRMVQPSNLPAFHPSNLPASQPSSPAYSPIRHSSFAHSPTRSFADSLHPSWLHLRVSPEDVAAAERMEELLADLRLHTVCQSARCPNVGECFGRGTATFMILGDVCTRNCRFCAVEKGRPSPVDPDEPQRVAEAAVRLGLRHVVVTSVTRDDLPDGGAAQFAATVRAVRERLPESTIEVLIPDFGGSLAALAQVIASGPQVINHNLETVPRLYPRVRPRADYHRSLGVLEWVKRRAPHLLTKSGLMLGLGETQQEVLAVMRDLRRVGCDLLTLGQYLQPTAQQLPVTRYVPPEEFQWYKEQGERMGFRAVAAGPLVRSSYRADEVRVVAL